MAQFYRYRAKYKTIKKNVFISLAATLLVTACNSNTKESESTNVLTTDTTSLYNNGISSDTATMAESVAVPQRDTVYLPAPKRVEAAKTNRTALKTSTPSTSSTTSPSTGSVPAKDTVSTVPSTAGTPAVSEKKGMSNSTKGAILGGVGGAVGGAVISKKKGKGAIIGGAVGAAGGYILGRKKDKKEAAKDTIPQ